VVRNIPVAPALPTAEALGTRGLAAISEPKLIVDEDRRALLGVTFVAPAVVDLLHSATVAVNAEVPLDQLWHAVPAFPTVSETWLYLLSQYGL
jgi:pyruvate/2-oxoglutarate dehydrogenase complex dihydrolipoamide dehydrogenase (E3) component